MNTRETGPRPQIDYECFNELIAELQASGHAATAQGIDQLLHHVAWTTGSELMGELGLAILAFQKTTPDPSPELQCALNRCMIMVKRIWPDIKGNA